MKERIKDIISYSDMIGSLVKKDLRGKYKGSVLGFLWTFINPLCQIIVYCVFSDCPKQPGQVLCLHDCGHDSVAVF